MGDQSGYSITRADILKRALAFVERKPVFALAIKLDNLS